MQKTLQLAAQVEHIVGLTLAAECEDAWLRDLVVLEVRPWPSARRMCVVVQPLAEWPDVDPDEGLARLMAARGFLRSEIAQAIHRKRTPELVFEVWPAHGGEEGR